MLQLIAIHIPKTAGKSFVEILRKVYGEDNVFWSGRADIEKDLLRFARSGVEEMPSVISGHFTFRQVEEIHRQARNVPIVTWLRDPVARAVSNYFYFIMRIQTGCNPSQAHRWNENMLQWGSRQDTRNRMSKFLKGTSLKDLFFFGLMEHFDEDLLELARRLGWPPVEPVHVNSNNSFREKFTAVQPETLELIKKWNSMDVALYQEACRLRKRRLDCLGSEG